MSEVQNTPEWFAARLGKATASRMGDLSARVKSGGWGASRANYMAQLVAERLTGVAAASFTNAAMQWGTDMEPEARTAYEFYAGVTVAEVGFINHPAIAMSGGSPDGFVGDDGLLEIKCPNTAGHIETLLGASIDNGYIKQMQWGMACSGRQWCDFVSYDPRLPERMRLFIKRVPRDSKIIADLDRDVREFLAELDGKVAALIKLYGASDVATAAE